jgi:hypothetical protein
MPQALWKSQGLGYSNKILMSEVPLQDAAVGLGSRLSISSEAGDPQG